MPAADPIPRDFRPLLALWPPLPGEASTGDSAAGLPVAPLPGGLINDTFLLGDRHVLQRLHRIFRPEVNEDIAALTPILRGRGVPVPLLVPARDGWPGVVLDEGAGELAGCWRILTRLPGETLHFLDGPSRARSVGELLGRFHAALADEPREMRHRRPWVHDTPRHLGHLARAVDAHRGHRLASSVGPLAEEILERAARVPVPAGLPLRVVHGDPKVSNFLFDGDRAVGVLDLDTMARAPLDGELGDAFRSWCARSREDADEAGFDLGLFAAAFRGWRAATAGLVTEAERAAIPAAAERIPLELASRFAADALEESYFGWDPSRFATRGDHALVRARNQLALAREVARLSGELERIVAEG